MQRRSTPRTRNVDPRKTADHHDPRQWLAYWEGRARRPSVLRPWHGECLELRAADTRITGRTIAVPPVARHAAVRAELVTVDAALVSRVCRWPELPAECTPREAARLLGVNVHTIYHWVASGKLSKRPKNQSRRRFYVGYAATGFPTRVTTGRTHRHPDRARRLMIPEPDVDWVVERFCAEEGRREHLVRLWQRQPFARNPDFARPRWLCPVCGRRPYLVYLPAGAMARRGRTWTPWRWQCDRCTGVDSETNPWRHPNGDGLHQTILKLTCGRASGTDFRRGLRSEL